MDSQEPTLDRKAVLADLQPFRQASEAQQGFPKWLISGLATRAFAIEQATPDAHERGLCAQLEEILTEAEQSEVLAHKDLEVAADILNELEAMYENLLPPLVVPKMNASNVELGMISQSAPRFRRKSREKA